MRNMICRNVELRIGIERKRGSCKLLARWNTEECGGLLTDTVLPLSNEGRRMSLVMA
jgi:hypothetical protein